MKKHILNTIKGARLLNGKEQKAINGSGPTGCYSGCMQGANYDCAILNDIDPFNNIYAYNQCVRDSSRVCLALCSN